METLKVYTHLAVPIPPPPPQEGVTMEGGMSVGTDKPKVGSRTLLKHTSVLMCCIMLSLVHVGFHKINVDHSQNT